MTRPLACWESAEWRVGTFGEGDMKDLDSLLSGPWRRKLYILILGGTAGQDEETVL